MFRQCLRLRTYVCQIFEDSFERLLIKLGYPFYPPKICKDRSCRKNQYKCKHEGYCINVRLVCDGKNHCLHGDDETNCG